MGEERPGLESYVYLHVHGFATHEEVTQHLGLEPSDAWNAGHTVQRSGKPFVLDHGKWQYGSTVYSPTDENDQLDALIATLLPHRLALHSMPAHWGRTLVIVHRTDSCNADMGLSAEQVAFAASIGAGVRIDIYSLPEDPAP